MLIAFGKPVDPEVCNTTKVSARFLLYSDLQPRLRCAILSTVSNDGTFASWRSQLDTTESSTAFAEPSSGRKSMRHPVCWTKEQCASMLFLGEENRAWHLYVSVPEQNHQKCLHTLRPHLQAAHVRMKYRMSEGPMYRAVLPSNPLGIDVPRCHARESIARARMENVTVRYAPDSKSWELVKYLAQTRSGCSTDKSSIASGIVRLPHCIVNGRYRKRSKKICTSQPKRMCHSIILEHVQHARSRRRHPFPWSRNKTKHVSLSRIFPLQKVKPRNRDRGSAGAFAWIGRPAHRPDSRECYRHDRLTCRIDRQQSVNMQRQHFGMRNAVMLRMSHSKLSKVKFHSSNERTPR